MSTPGAILPQAIVFDMDGLLADTEPLSFRAWSSVIARDYGVAITDEDARWSSITVGKSGPIVWELIRDRFALPVELPRDIPSLAERTRERYDAILAEGVPAMPGGDRDGPRLPGGGDHAGGGIQLIDGAHRDDPGRPRYH